MTYKEYEQELYKMAEKDNDPQYAKEGLDFSKEIQEIERFYKNGYSIESAYYAFTY